MARVPRFALVPTMKEPTPHIQDIPGVKSYDVKELVFAETIGRGAFAEVNKCLIKSSNKIVAFKKVTEQCEQVFKIFKKEARLLSTTSHRNIVGLEGVCYSPFGLLLKYCMFSFKPFGGDKQVSTLKDLLQILNTSSCEGFEMLQVHIAHDVACGLSYLHNHRVAHRDLKPANVLVSNQHYLSESEQQEDLQHHWQSHPIVAMLADFGEGRSELCQTATVAHTRTTRLDRGTPVFMAPETHCEAGTHRGSLEDFLMIDMWSFGMVLWCLINPDMQYPYAKEIMEERAKGNIVNARQLVVELLRKGIIPRGTDKYNNHVDGVWAGVHCTMAQCLNINMKARSSAHIAVSLLNPTANRHHCSVSQSSMLEAGDYQVARGGDVTNSNRGSENACTFLALMIGDSVQNMSGKISPSDIRDVTQDIILNFPSVVNGHRNRDEMYAVDTALDILQQCGVMSQQYKLLNHMPATQHPEPREDAKAELQHALVALTSKQENTFAVYTNPPYTWLLLKLKDSLCVIDTHPVGRDFGGQEAAMVLHVHPTADGCRTLSEWLFCRVKDKERLQHDMVVLAGTSDHFHTLFYY